jgi:hypothetical protein
MFLIPFAILLDFHLSLHVTCGFWSGVVLAIALSALEGNLLNRAFFFFAILITPLQKSN